MSILKTHTHIKKKREKKTQAPSTFEHSFNYNKEKKKQERRTKKAGHRRTRKLVAIASDVNNNNGGPIESVIRSTHQADAQVRIAHCPELVEERQYWHPHSENPFRGVAGAARDKSRADCPVAAAEEEQTMLD